MGLAKSALMAQQTVVVLVDHPVLPEPVTFPVDPACAHVGERNALPVRPYSSARWHVLGHTDPTSGWGGCPFHPAGDGAVDRPSPGELCSDSLFGSNEDPDWEETMEHTLSENMRRALVETLVLIGRASEAAGGAGASDDAMIVTQRVHTIQGGLSLVDPELIAAAGALEGDQVVTPSLNECHHWLTEAAAVLDGAVRSETARLLPAGLLTVRADLADTIRLLEGLKVSAP